MIHITNGQNDNIVGFLTEKDITFNEQTRNIETYQDSFEFIAFGSHKYAKFLTDMNRIIVPEEDGGYSEYVINKARKRRDSSNQVRVKSFGSYLLLTVAKVIKPTSLLSYTVKQSLDFITSGTEWRSGFVESNAIRTFHIENYTEPFSFLQTVANEFNLKIKFRIETDGKRVTGRYIDLVEDIGEWRGREITFGKDLDAIERTEDLSNVVTKLVCIGPEDGEGNRLEIEVDDEDALQRWGRPDPVTGELRHLVGVYEPTSERTGMTETELEQYGRTELSKRINASVVYGAEVVDLENVPGMENKKIRLGDTVRIKDEKFNPPLYVEARIFEQKRDVFTKSNKRVTLGDFTEYSEEDLKAVIDTLSRQVKSKISQTQLMNYTYGKSQIDGKDQSTFDDSTIFTEQYAERKIPKQPTAPASPNQGDQWIDTSSDPIALKIYNGTEWQTVEGPQGVPGTPGEDGQTSYVHTAYANSADGTVDFDISDSTNKSYLGTYTDFNIDDSLNPADYSWQKVKGDTGPQGPKGEQGVPGQDGIAHMGQNPPNNPAVDSTWFQTNSAGEVIAIKKWTGSAWSTALMTVDVLNVLKLSAFTADLGDVTTGNLSGVNINGSTFNSIKDSRNYTTIENNHIHSEGDFWDPNGGSGNGIVNMYVIFDINDGKFSLKSGQINADGTRRPWETEVTMSDVGLVVRNQSGGGTYIGNGGDIGFGDWFDGPNSTGSIVSLADKMQINTDVLAITGEIENQQPIELPLFNGWTSFGGDYATATYLKDKNGVVHLEGLIRAGSTTSGTVIAQLPGGYRPTKKLPLNLLTSDDGNPTRVDIFPSSDFGRIKLVYPKNTTFLSLNGISFLAE